MLYRYNYVSKGFPVMITYGGELSLTDGDNTISYSAQSPVFEKNNYGYNEMKVDTNTMEV